MPVELFLGPIFRPVVRARALMFSPHRISSHYVPNIIELPEDGVSSYSIRREFGQGGKVYNVFDDSKPSANVNDRIYYMLRSRAVKGVYKVYKEGLEKPVAVLRAGIRSNVFLFRNDDDHFELGWHAIGHRVDSLDGYRLFQLADGQTYQWTTKGKFLERVHNLGEKESEIRERVAVVETRPGKGFVLKVDESKVPLEIAFTTAMISFIDQWNTMYGTGGIYYGYQPRQISWKRE